MEIIFSNNPPNLKVSLSGNYINYDDNSAKERLFQAISSPKIKCLIIDARQLNQWDSTLLVILSDIYRIANKHNISISAPDLPSNLSQLIKLSISVNRNPSLPQETKLPFFESIGTKTLSLQKSIINGIYFINQVLKSLNRLIYGTSVTRKIDWLFALEDCGYKAIGIVSLISFMVGLILAFVGAIQLQTFGAQIYVASLVAIAMIRIMGAIMVGVVMAGRTGASYAATIGSMQVNEEIDALKTFGIPTTDFLVLPRISALVITMPILTILADAMGIIGGAVVGALALDIPIEEYLKYTQNALSLNNFLVGLFHGLIFGIIISLCGCYFGMNCGRNADSVGKATTQAVVTSIVWMIVATGIMTIIFKALNI